MVARRRPGKGPVAVVLVVVALVTLAGCGVVRRAASTLLALDRAGFTSADVQPIEGEGWEISVEKDVEDLDAAAAEAAGIVWRKLPFRVERLEVTCGNGFGGKGRFSADRAELEERFGPRDPDLDGVTQGEAGRTLALVLVGLFVLGLVVLGAIVILVVVLVRRSRRRRPPPGPWGPGGPTGPGGPAGWGPPGGEVSQPPPPRYGPPA